MAQDYWHGKRVLVTGATGMVGSWLCDALVRRGAQVTALVRDRIPNSNLYRMGLNERIDIAHGDICDYETCLRVLNEYETDTLFHLAAQTIVGIANRAPLSTFDANIRGTWNLMEAARLTPTIRRVVFASSDKAYGAQDDLPYRENAPLTGLHPYDASKSCSDLIVQTYYHSFGLPVGISRCGNIFGGGDLNWNRIVPETMKAVWEDRAPVIRSDGSPTRDYLYVKDVAEAYLCLGQGLDDPRHQGQAFNFSYELPKSVLDMVRTTLAALDAGHLAPDVQGSGIPPGEIPHQYLASDKARAELGWQPSYGLEDGLRETWEWYRALFDSWAARRARAGSS